MGKRLFGSLELIECLRSLGFTHDTTCKGHHVKFIPPKSHKVPHGVYPFMMLQYGKKQFNRHSCARYISELVKLGFDKAKIQSILGS